MPFFVCPIPSVVPRTCGSSPPFLVYHASRIEPQIVGFFPFTGSCSSSKGGCQDSSPFFKDGEHPSPCDVRTLHSFYPPPFSLTTSSFPSHNGSLGSSSPLPHWKIPGPCNSFFFDESLPFSRKTLPSINPGFRHLI